MTIALTSPRSAESVPLPTRWEWLARGFRKYATCYVRQHFHAVRLSRTSAPVPAGDAPLLVVLNHPSWWDPLLCFVLSHLFPDGREHYAAIDAVAVEKYKFFTRLGFFGVDTTTLRGGAAFLRTTSTILSESNRTVWITAQGRFSDVRTRPLDLRPGVGHVAARLDRGSILPLAVEYPFWSERTPEALARFGTPIDVGEAPGRTGKDWTQRIEDALAETLDGLNAESMTRDPDCFMTLLDGKSGVGGVYDLWRRTKSWAQGKRFDSSHGGRP